MRNILATCLFTFSTFILFAQKKVLDHSVYDGWQRIGERMISNDGKWVVYTINPQEGDNELVITSSNASYKLSVARGYNAVITEDSRYAVFKIKPFFQSIKEAKIKKKKPDDMPKDSFAIVELGKDSIWKTAAVKNFKTPEKESGWVAYHLEKVVEKKVTDRKKPENADKKVADSLVKVIDSLQIIIQSIPERKKKKRDDELSQDVLENTYADAEGDEPANGQTDAGTDLILRNLNTGKESRYENVVEYYFSKKGGQLLVEKAKNPKDSLSQTSVVVINLNSLNETRISSGGNEFKNFTFSEDGTQVAFVAERDAKPKELQKFYKIWYFKQGMDSAVLLADKNSVGMKLGMTISEYGNLEFSKSGNRLYFGTAAIQPPKDTSLVEMDLAKLDIWHYKDDYLQPQQLSRLQRDLRNSFSAVYQFDRQELKQLGTEEIPTIITTDEGDGDIVVGVSDYGNRVESQWTGSTKKNIYAIPVFDGEATLIKKDLEGFISQQLISPTGKFIMWYDSKAKNYFAWDGTATKNISVKIKSPLWDEEHDSPSDPSPYGIMSWLEGDSIVMIYDRYNVYAVSMDTKQNPTLVNAYNGRIKKHSFRYVRTDADERFIKQGQWVLFRIFDEVNKRYALSAKRKVAGVAVKDGPYFENFVFGQVNQAKDKTGEFLYTKENYESSPDLYCINKDGEEVRLSKINSQQADYNWGTAELFKWKAFNGKMSEGVLYKPENFDPKKKYPLLLYFYETHSNTLNSYIPPTPTGSRLNISFFVSRGYVVLSPDIHYTNGHPAKSCYDYVVSAAQDLAKKPWIDGKNIGIQGQSWGGIQVAQLVTMTNMFKAAWSGAPVANMTSAYGGIRWESGMNRQFQYEKTQSRIGATLWERPDLYIENSPLFHVPKIKTPMVIMANDADGAVPWYQGIELFTAMRRLGKQVWMLNYNGEAHNLRERRNQKDISIREQQFFDWLLKGEKPPKWITEGVPAVKKGKDWGLELVD